MWFADVFCDLEWVNQRKGVLGPARFRLRGARSGSVAIELLYFGDDHDVKHLRVILHTDARETADRIIDLNAQTWVASLESAIMMQTGRPFHVVHLPAPQQFAIGVGQGERGLTRIDHSSSPPRASSAELRARCSWDGRLGRRSSGISVLLSPFR